jgi:Uma2 family endonuclease
MTAARKLDPPRMTVEEFFAWDGGGHVGKLELVNGVVRAMSPPSESHSIIQGNVYFAIRTHLKATGSRCRVGTEAPVIPPMMRKVNARAPDLAVTCASPSPDMVFENPILIVEILSPSNEAATWETIGTLAALATMREILVVQSTVVEARVFTRDAAGGWPNEPVVSTAGGTVRLTALGLDLPVADIYEGTLLEADARGG